LRNRPLSRGERYRLLKLALEWVTGQGATEHMVYRRTAGDSLTLVGTTSKNPSEVPDLRSFR
jgi:hypothetical protein